MMTVIDAEGKAIQVTDLKAALQQAKRFTAYDSRNGKPLTGALLQRTVYWKDMLAKLQALQTENEQP